MALRVPVGPVVILALGAALAAALTAQQPEATSLFGRPLVSVPPTGEQKALLIGLVLAHAALVSDMAGTAPVILLDEVVAHLDPDRRAVLFAALGELGSQVWMTGADPTAFADIVSRADVIDVRTLS